MSYGNSAFGHGKAGRPYGFASLELKDKVPTVFPWLLLSNPTTTYLPTATPWSLAKCFIATATASSLASAPVPPPPKWT